MFAVILFLATIANTDGQRFFARFPATTRINEGQTFTAEMNAFTFPPTTYEGNVIITVEVESMTATFGEDFTIVGSSTPFFNLTFSAASPTSSQQQIRTLNDNFYETQGGKDETFTLQVINVDDSSVSGVVVQRNAILSETVQVTIVEVDTVRVNFSRPQGVRIEMNRIIVTEGVDPYLKLLVQAFDFFAHGFMVGVACTPSSSTDTSPAELGEDFNPLSENARFSSLLLGGIIPTSSEDFIVTIINDTVAEPLENFVCLLRPAVSVTGAGIFAIEPDTVRIRIIDDDVLIAKWQSRSYEAREGEEFIQPVLFTQSQYSGVVQMIASPAAIVFPNTPTNETKFVDGSMDTVTFMNMEYKIAFVFSSFGDIDTSLLPPPNFTFINNSMTAPGNFFIMDDDALECDEIAYATFDFSNDATALYSTARMEPLITYLIIRDNDRVRIGFIKPSYHVNESSTTIRLTVELIGAFEIELTAFVECGGGTATNTLDYSVTNLVTLKIPPSPLDPRIEHHFDIEILDDFDVESAEYFICNITNTSIPCKPPKEGAFDIINENRLTIVNISDNDNIRVQFDPTTYSVNEGDEEVEVTLVTSSTSFSTSFTVTLLYQDITTEGISDYTAVTTVTFGAGDSSSSFEIPIVNDNIAELKETFNITIISVNQTFVKIGDDDTAMVDILDNDDLTVFFEPASYNVTEGETATLILVTNVGYDFDFKVNVFTMDGTAIAEGDYESGAPGYQATFTPSTAMPGSSTVEVPTNDDNIFEETERFFANIVVLPDSDKQVSEGNPSMAAVDILDNTTVLVYFDPDEYEVDEGEPAKLILRTDVVVKKRFEVIVIPLNDSAISPGDYEGVEKIAIFEVNSSMSMVTFNTFMNDPVERIESFNAVISVTPEMMAMGVDPGDPDTAVILIKDITNITVMFSQEIYIVRENEGSVNITITASDPYAMEYTIPVRATDGTAKAGPNFDYIGKPFMPIMPAGETSVSFTIDIINDEIFELQEFFVLDLEDPSPEIVFPGSPNMARVNILDDDSKVSVLWEEPMYTVRESDGSVAVKLISSKPVPFNYTVQVSATDISAQRLVDYLFPVTMDVTFLANETEKILNIVITEDIIDELDETFNLTVTADNEPDVEVGDPSVTTVLIEDNEVINVSFSPPDYSVREGENVSLRVVLDKVPAKPVTVTINITDVSTNPDDYEPRTCTITFFAGETENEDCIISARSDDVKECDEDLRADLSIPEDQTGVMTEDPDMALVTIEDNTVMTISIELPRYTVKEDVGTFDVNVTASAPTSFDYNVTVTMTPGTAVAGQDYVPRVYVVPFSAGETESSFFVELIDDNILENPPVNSMTDLLESFTLNLVLGTEVIDKGILLGSNSNSDVIIMDNDVVVRFRQPSVTVLEGNDAPVEVIVEGDLSQSIIITVTPMNVTAISSEDYDGDDLTYTFIGQNDRFMDSSTQTILTIPDGIFEDIEEFKLNMFVNDPSRISIGSPGMMTVFIQDALFDQDNATIIGDPLYEVPLSDTDDIWTDPALGEVALCYEVHGLAGSTFNVISDRCVSVNAHYRAGVNDTVLNFIQQIGITADGDTLCHSLEFNRVGCVGTIDGSEISTSWMNVDGIRVRKHRNGKRFTVSVKNCDARRRLTMWVICTKRTTDENLHFQVLYADGLTPESHGLLGQFFHLSMEITPYLGLFDGKLNHEGAYNVTLTQQDGSMRSFVAHFDEQRWDRTKKPCLYAGNRQAGPAAEVKNDGTVIEGEYQDYEVSHLLSINLKNPDFKRYSMGTCIEPDTGTPIPGK